MNNKVFKCSVDGYKNIIKGLRSQDYIEFKKVDNNLICSVADGHSSEYFTYSLEGAKLACRASIEILERYIDKDLNLIKEELKKYNIQKLIYDKWLELVKKHYYTKKPLMFKTEYLRYSTTLLAVLYTNDFILYLKIGDGNIIVKENEIYKKIINVKSNNHVVDSFGRTDAYKNMNYYIENKNEGISNIIIFTDGYENSFDNDLDMFKNLDNTILRYNKSVFSRWQLMNSYPSYLKYLTKNKSKDDISILYLM